MTLEDYIINFLLIALVIRQIRGKKLTTFGLLWPVALVLYFAGKYLRTIPTAGNDVPFIVSATLVGATLGILCGTFTRIYEKDGILIGKASWLAAVLWIAGVGSRLAFGLYGTHGGGPAIGRFSVAQHLSGEKTWIAALLLMALAEVIGRTLALVIKSQTFKQYTSKQHTAA